MRLSRALGRITSRFVPRTTHRTHDLTITVAADPALFHDVRERFGGWMRAWSSDATELGDDLLVVLSELLANAAEAAPSAHADLSVTASVAGDVVCLEVCNPVAPWIDPATRWDLHDPLRPGGRGLLIVSALVDEVEVVHDVAQNVTVVRCRRSIDDR